MVMYLGEMVELADKEALFRKPLHPYAKALLASVPVPDVHHKKEFIPLEGELTSPINPGPGCRFAARCHYATDLCRTQTPELREYEPGHMVRCHNLEKI